MKKFIWKNIFGGLGGVDDVYDTSGRKLARVSGSGGQYSVEYTKDVGGNAYGEITISDDIDLYDYDIRTPVEYFLTYGHWPINVTANRHKKQIAEQRQQMDALSQYFDGGHDAEIW